MGIAEATDLIMTSFPALDNMLIVKEKKLKEVEAVALDKMKCIVALFYGVAAP